VTPNISYASKKIRRWIVMIFLLVFTGCYIVPINFINNNFVPSEEFWLEKLEIPQKIVNRVLPSLSSLAQTLLFSICPSIFTFVADAEGSATSREKAEERAMIFFWYFYIVARFMGVFVWDAILNFNQGNSNSIEKSIFSVITDIANTVPTTLGPVALTYIIFSATVTFPVMYFLNLNNFMTSIFRLRYINRQLKGGGFGQEVPYRLYVDLGYVFSCITAFAPVYPIIGPFCLLYFIIISPMLRWMMVFSYRPKFDGGGSKWPQLHHIIISSLLLGQVSRIFAVSNLQRL